MSDLLHSIGIDVCKRFLDIHVYTTGKCWRVPNTIIGLLSVRSQFPEPEQVKRIVLESTGGYEREAALWLTQAGYSVAVINARQGRNFARAMNQQAKTDQVDAQILALFGDKITPPVRPLSSEAQQQLDDLVTRRRQLVDILTAERNRMALLRGKAQANVERHIEWLDAQIQDLDQEIEAQIQACQAWRQTQKLVLSVPGVGKVMAATLLSALPMKCQWHRRLNALQKSLSSVNRNFLSKCARWFSLPESSFTTPACSLKYSLYPVRALLFYRMSN